MTIEGMLKSLRAVSERTRNTHNVRRSEKINPIPPLSWTVIFEAMVPLLYCLSNERRRNRHECKLFLRICLTIDYEAFRKAGMNPVRGSISVATGARVGGVYRVVDFSHLLKL